MLNRPSGPEGEEGLVVAPRLDPEHNEAPASNVPEGGAEANPSQQLHSLRESSFELSTAAPRGQLSKFDVHSRSWGGREVVIGLK